MRIIITCILILFVLQAGVRSHEKSCKELVSEVLEKLSDIEKKLVQQDQKISLLTEQSQGHLEDSCGTPPNVPNGKITGRKTRDSFMVECNTGYALKGDNPVLCNLSGNWNQTPSCEPIACGVPRIPKNGSICKMKGDGFGATIIMECEEGFYISGNPVVSCSSNGRWTQVPSCEIIASCISDRAIDFGLKNVALGKKVILSSRNHHTTPGSLMVDGNRSSTYPCACTKLSKNPYAIVDLQEAYDIYFIYIVNRGDCCPERLHDLTVFIGNDTSRLGLAARHTVPIGAGCTLKFDKPVNGRYVKLQIEAHAEEYLTICELEIYSI